MEKLILLQNELFVNLKKAESNYRKSPKERIKRAYVQTRLDILEKQFVEFTDRHQKIVTLASDDRREEYFTENMYEGVEELYVNFKSLLIEALQLFGTTTMPQQSTGIEASGTKYCDVKLPRINLPSFSGKYEEWQSFFDMFSSLIHNNSNITPVQKLHYLKGNLTGEALNLLRNLSTTDANYEEAWFQLVRRYNNKRYNCNIVLKNLFSFKKIHTESANAIKYLVDSTATCLKSLQNMGINTSTWDAIIVYIVVSKLDPESMKQWEHQLDVDADELPTWDQLRVYLEHRFRSLEMVDSSLVRPSQAKTKAFHTSIENNRKNSEIECVMCRDKHYIFNCKQFRLMTPQDRQDFVQNNKLCFNCLSPTHAAMKCRKSISCRKCSRRHHTLLHFERESSILDHNIEDFGTFSFCNVCGKQFLNDEDLKTHNAGCQRPVMRQRRPYSTSNSNKMWNCASCNQLFATARELYRHKRGEDRPPGTPLMAYVCEECDKVLGSMCALHTHKKMHKVSKPGYPCRVCGRRFNQSGHLAIHMRMHTGERPYPCDLCSKAFKVKVERDDHRRTHTGERPFACAVCPKTFTAAARLREHARIHTDQRPYKCDICGAAFRRPYARTVHTLIHTGEKPHECDVCGTAFRRSGDMWKHKRTIHSILANCDGN